MYVVKSKVFLHMVKTAGVSFHHACIEAGHQIQFNQRHLCIDCLPVRYSQLPRYTLVRDKVSWYESFYNFYLGVEGFMSFMLHDPNDDGTISPISIDEFVRRSINLKDTLLRFPNKARVFNNILQSQGKGHFVTTYYKGSIDRENISTYEQFNMSLYEWFFYRAGCDTATQIPLNSISDIEDIFDIKMKHDNVTRKKDKKYISDETKQIVT